MTGMSIFNRYDDRIGLLFDVMESGHHFSNRLRGFRQLV